MTDEEKIKQLTQQVHDLSTEFHDYVNQKRKEESQRLRTALLIAGGIISALGSFIWVEIIWPVIKAGK